MTHIICVMCIHGVPDIIIVGENRLKRKKQFQLLFNVLRRRRQPFALITYRVNKSLQKLLLRGKTIQNIQLARASALAHSRTSTGEKEGERYTYNIMYIPQRSSVRITSRGENLLTERYFLNTHRRQDILILTVLHRQCVYHAYMCV